MSESLHQRSLITCIPTGVSSRLAASVKYQACRSRIWMTALWLFPSPLVPSWGGAGGDFLKVCRCGQGMLKLCRDSGGWTIASWRPNWYLLPLMVFFRSHGRRLGFRWVRREFQQQHEHKGKQRSECTSLCLKDALFLFFLLTFIFSCTLWMTPRYVSIPEWAMKESDRWLRVRCSGTESSDKR